MAPSVMLDTSDDFKPWASSQRTLLLCPPSLSSHPEALNNVLESHDRSVTDIQMLDRLSLGLVALPESTYDVILILSDADGSRGESQRLLGRDVLSKVVRALKPNGKLHSQDGGFAANEGQERTEAILAGLLVDPSGSLVKPGYSNNEAVPLRFGKKKTSTPAQAPLSPNSKRKAESQQPSKLAGVGFVDFSDDFDKPVIEGEDDYDDELIDEDTLLDEEDLARPIVQPPECRPRAGKRRRACKDCTCGLKDKLDAEDAAKRSQADTALNTMKLDTDDLAEVDFTVQGKVGSCGNCALGDAFRCDGCPYIGLPAFKPGEEVRLVNNEVQL
ncbi:DUF689-domain-containing protein [Xylona heveae TC161]|uniref:DUF689-domain-containing protein n=1 Tax=Xylona heveae (strain CBS 132557 / TC161) TaxID=1328760 RepID=A0A165J233_XYLHT|nr:DUF689-domain-containing protein [Xylona heveae TC161]KZF25630.1 DUF689-domain-containing protein [Xylona heveae TC161]